MEVCGNRGIAVYISSLLTLLLWADATHAQMRDLELGNVSAEYQDAQQEYNYSVEICNFGLTAVVEDFMVEVKILSCKGSEVCADRFTTFTVTDDLGPDPLQQCVTKTGSLTPDPSVSCDGNEHTYCTFHVTVDTNNDVTEDDENNNEAEVTITWQGPDLTPGNSVDCVYNISEQRYEVSFDVTNLRCEPAVVTDSTIKVAIFHCLPSDNAFTFLGNLFEQDPINGCETVPHSIAIDGPAGCKCCRVWLDSNKLVMEADEENNVDNDNIILVELNPAGSQAILEKSATVGSEISNITDMSVTATNQVVDPPPGWTVDVTPLSVVVPPNGTAPITLTYTPPPNSTPTTIQVLTTEAETGFTQDNLFVFGCISDADCNDGDVCTQDQCTNGSCEHTGKIYGDLDNDGDVDLFDLFCILNCFSQDFITCSFRKCDLEPCLGDGDVDLFDLFAVLNAFSGDDPCCSP